MAVGTLKKTSSTRETILHSIKLAPQATVEELAEAAEVSPVTVRHHLNALQAEGLIEAEAIRRKVGRPYHVYTLSEMGQELFPKRYVRLSTLLLEEMKERLPQDVVIEVFRGVVERVLSEHDGEYEHLTIEEKLDFLVELLGEEGFLSVWQESENGYHIIEYSCPYRSIGGTHVEVCTFDRELMYSVLNLPVQQNSCMLEGADCCEFTIERAAAVAHSSALEGS